MFNERVKDRLESVVSVVDNEVQQHKKVLIPHKRDDVVVK